MSTSLADRLRTETRALHTTAERSSFMRVLLRGRMARTAYCALLRNLHAIYAALEPALARHAGHPLLAPVSLSALRRLSALEHDLRVLHGPAALDALALQPAAACYAARLHDLDAARPELLLAHGYVRYLGDLSGGQMLRGIVAASPAIDGAGAVAFYDFGDPARTRALTQALRAGLASLSVAGTQADELVDEAKLAFALHHRLFEELATEFGLAGDGSQVAPAR